MNPPIAKSKPVDKCGNVDSAPIYLKSKSIPYSPFINVFVRFTCGTGQRNKSDNLSRKSGNLVDADLCNVGGNFCISQQ